MEDDRLRSMASSASQSAYAAIQYLGVAVHGHGAAEREGWMAEAREALYHALMTVDRYIESSNKKGKKNAISKSKH